MIFHCMFLSGLGLLIRIFAQRKTPGPPKKVLLEKIVHSSPYLAGKRTKKRGREAGVGQTRTGNGHAHTVLIDL